MSASEPSDKEQLPGDTGGDGDVQVLEPGGSRVRFRLTENPVHQHFTYTSADDKSTCKICKVQLFGKNSTSLGKLIDLFVFAFFYLR